MSRSGALTVDSELHDEACSQVEEGVGGEGGHLIGVLAHGDGLGRRALPAVELEVDQVVVGLELEELDLHLHEVAERTGVVGDAGGRTVLPAHADGPQFLLGGLGPLGTQVLQGAVDLAHDVQRVGARADSKVPSGLQLFVRDRGDFALAGVCLGHVGAVDRRKRRGQDCDGRVGQGGQVGHGRQRLVRERQVGARRRAVHVDVDVAVVALAAPHRRRRLQQEVDHVVGLGVLQVADQAAVVLHQHVCVEHLVRLLLWRALLVAVVDHVDNLVPLVAHRRL